MKIEKPYKTLSSEIIWKSPWYFLQHDAVRFPDGSEGTYTIVRRGEAVFIIPILEDGRIVLIRNYRYTIGGWLWEIPAGSIEGDATPEHTARKELLEEVGGTTDSFQPLGGYYTMPGISDEYVHVFIARGVRLGEPHREPSEVMEVHLFHREEILRMIHAGEIKDGPSALALLMGLNTKE